MLPNKLLALLAHFHNQNTDCENCSTKPCTIDTSTFPTPCEDANLAAESSVSIEPCRTYTPLSTNVCRIPTANHKIDMTTQRSDAAFIRRREESRGGRRRGGNIPCNSLAVAVNVPCATSQPNASKLDAVFVDQCFVQCLLA